MGRSLRSTFKNSMSLEYISGCETNFLNGFYSPSPDIHNGKAVWACGKNRIYSKTTGKFIIGPADEMEKESGYVLATAAGASDPSGVEAWTRWDGSEWIESRTSATKPVQKMTKVGTTVMATG